MFEFAIQFFSALGIVGITWAGIEILKKLFDSGK